jgi:peptidoglycan/LPS O-acetylase OafA/YrhL
MIYCYRTSLAVLDGFSMAAILLVLLPLTSWFPQLSLSALFLPWMVISFAYWKPEFAAQFRPKADLSYGIYIYAFPIQQSVLVLLPDATALHVFALSLPVTLLLAWFSWNAIERRALRLKRLLS